MITSDLKLRKSLSNGRMNMSSNGLITTNVVQNLMTNVTSSQRELGYFDYYKIWWHIQDDADGIGVDPEILFDFPTLSDDDYCMAFVMSDRETVSDITGYETGTDTRDKYGVAYLDANITAGDSTFDVVVKNAAMASGNDVIFRDGDTIKITAKTSHTSTSGTEEVHTIDGVPVVASDGVTITITIADSAGFANSFTADGVTRVQSIIEEDDIETSVTAMSVTSGATGDYDDTTYAVTLDNLGTVDEDWTLTFTDATHFRLDGDSLGTGVATGQVSVNFSPTNSVTGYAYFTIDYNGFSGTFQAGDTIEFTTKCAAVPWGIKRVVPAESSSLTGNRVGACLTVEASE